MDRRIALRFPVVTRDEIGGVIEAFADLPQIWAASSLASGKEFFAGEAKAMEAPCNFTIRYRAEVNEKWRVLHDGKIYELISIPLEIGRRQWMDLPCKLLADQSAGTVLASAQSFVIDIDEGADEVEVEFPTAFANTPRGIMVQLLIPDGGFIFLVAVLDGSLTSEGFTGALGAIVPGEGYRLSIQAAL